MNVFMLYLFAMNWYYLIHEYLNYPEFQLHCNYSPLQLFPIPKLGIQCITYSKHCSRRALVNISLDGYVFFLDWPIIYIYTILYCSGIAESITRAV